MLSLLSLGLSIYKFLNLLKIPSKLGVLFSLDSGASIYVSNLPIFPILAYHFLTWSKSSLSDTDFKTLVLANQFEVPILCNVTLTLHTSIQGSTCTLIIPFAVANTKHIILGTPFFEKKMLNLKKLNRCHLASNTESKSHIKNYE